MPGPAPRQDSPRALIAWTIAMVTIAGLAIWALILVRGVLLLSLIHI